MTSRGVRGWSGGSLPLVGPEILSEILSTASDLTLVISGTGGVQSVLVNPAHPCFGRLDGWEGRDLRETLTVESVPKLDAKLAEIGAGRGPGRALELNHAETTGWEFPIRYTFHRVGPDGALLMLGRDQRPIAEMQQRLVRAQLALERDYEAQREYDTRFRVLMETTREAFVFVSLSNGRISDVNAAAAALFGAEAGELASAPFAAEFEGAGRGEILATLAADGGAGSIEATARRNHRRLRLSSVAFRAAGERLLICRVEPVEASTRRGDEMTAQLATFFAAAVDAIVFTDAGGVIRAANEAFLNLADAAEIGSVRGRSLGDFLARGAVDLRVVTENAARHGHMRLYATRLASTFGNEVAVEVSATFLAHRDAPAIAFVLRDTSRAEAMRMPAVGPGDDGARSVMELVGTSTLKDIVAETTDVIEKMCIETAIELTRNNRVAAAEMLGLSRQSLYVKLRKYGLIGRDDSRGEARPDGVGDA